MAARPPAISRVDPTWPEHDDDTDPVSEFTAEIQGAGSPFGEDVEFPLPVEGLRYEHPGPEDRPHLAARP